MKRTFNPSIKYTARKAMFDFNITHSAPVYKYMMYFRKQNSKMNTVIDAVLLYEMANAITASTSIIANNSASGIKPCNSSAVIDLAADRVPYICQYQSLNVFITKKDLHMLHFTAWKKYCRKSLQRVDNVSNQVEQLSIQLAVPLPPEIKKSNPSIKYTARKAVFNSSITHSAQMYKDMMYFRKQHAKINIVIDTVLLYEMANAITASTSMIANNSSSGIEPIIDLAADRVIDVCQSQSLNIFITKKDLHMLHFTAWKNYCRSKSLQRADNVFNKVEKSSTQLAVPLPPEIKKFNPSIKYTAKKDMFDSNITHSAPVYKYMVYFTKQHAKMNIAIDAVLLYEMANAAFNIFTLSETQYTRTCFKQVEKKTSMCIICSL